MSTALAFATPSLQQRASKGARASPLPLTCSSLQSRTPKRSRDSSSDDYLCVICLDTVVDAHQTGCCGALMCSKCCETVSAGQSRCPNCRHADATFHKDAFRERMAAALVMTCDTCGFSAKRDEYLAHAATGHETPEAKIKRLESELRASELKCAHLSLIQRQHDEEQQRRERRTLQFHRISSELMIELSMWKRFNYGSVFCRVFAGTSGTIAVTAALYKVTIEWCHFNVSLTVQRIDGQLQKKAEITVRLAHLDRSKDRADHFTLTPSRPLQQLGNWMSIQELQQFRTDGNSITFAVNVPRD